MNKQYHLVAVEPYAYDFKGKTGEQIKGSGYKHYCQDASGKVHAFKFKTAAVDVLTFSKHVPVTVTFTEVQMKAGLTLKEESITLN